MDKANDSVNLVRELLAHVKTQKTVTAVVGLFSGGNDSTAMIHLMRPFLTHIAHVNTLTGVAETTEFVRKTASNIAPYIEKTPPDSYANLVLGNVLPGWQGNGPNIWEPVFKGFPGPAQHNTMFQRLKERGINQITMQLRKPYSRTETVVYFAARRASESKRRKRLGALGPIEWKPGVVYISPILYWDKIDVNHYLNLNRVPLNEVSQLIHMSGECLCGCYAREHELEEIAYWFPNAAKSLYELEDAVKAKVQSQQSFEYVEVNGRKIAAYKIPEKQCHWGFGQRGLCDGACNS